MKITILQKGGQKYHEALEKAVRYFAAQLMSTRMTNTLEIRLEVRATKLKKRVAGTCSTVPVGSKASKKFTIVLQRDMLPRDMFATIAHEMVHVQQKATNRLQFRRWSSDKQMHVRWEGKDMGVFGDIPYRIQPWEVEAYAKEKPLMVTWTDVLELEWLNRERVKLQKVA